MKTHTLTRRASTRVHRGRQIRCAPRRRSVVPTLEILPERSAPTAFSVATPIALAPPQFAQFNSSMDSTPRDFWRTYGNGIAAGSESIRLIYPPSPSPKADEVPLRANTQLSEPVIAFGSPRSQETLDDLSNRAPARPAAKPASTPQQGNNAINNAALAGAGSGGRGVGGVSTPNVGGGGSVGGSGGGGGGGANWNQLLNNVASVASNAVMPAAMDSPVAAAATTNGAAATAVPVSPTASATFATPPSSNTPAAAAQVASTGTVSGIPDTPQSDSGNTPAAPGISVPPAKVFGSNLIVNGGFETGDFTGWTWTGDQTYVSVTPPGYNSNYAASHDSSNASNGTLEQTFVTIPGATYQISYTLEATSDVTSTSLTTTFGNQVISTATNFRAFPWTTFTSYATATGPSTTLQFTAQDVTGDIRMDDISVYQTGIMGSSLPLCTSVTASCNCGCPNQPGSVMQTSTSSTGTEVPESSNAPVRYADGVATIAETDLSSDGFGFPWGQTRSWTNGQGYSNGVNGNGWVDTYTPQLIQADGSTDNTLAVIANGTSAYYYDLVNSTYQSRFDDPSQLTYDSDNDTYTLIDGQGDQIVFNGFGSSWLPAQRGQFQSLTSADGVTMAVTSHTEDGHIAEMQRSATDSDSNAITESWLYSYLPSTDPNAGLLNNVTLRRQVNGGDWSTVRQVAYTYYDGTQQYGGNLGDLMTAAVEDGDGNVLSTSYYRYYTPGDANGYTHGLEYVFNPDSYDRLTAANPGVNLSDLTDDQVAPYADNYFQYDSQQRVTQETVQGAGDSTTGGLGKYSYSYTPNSNATYTPSLGNWAMKTVVTAPDYSTDTVYTNAYGNVLLDDHHDPASGVDTDDFYAYNGQGQVVLHAAPSAVQRYSDSYDDLLDQDSQSGLYQDLNNTSGLITRYDYYTTTTAGETTAGGVANYLEDEQIQQGQQGTPIPQETWQYYAHAFDGQTIAPVATDTVYGGTGEGDPRMTSYAYTWVPGTALMQSETETAPLIAATQNGPGGTAYDVTTTYFDQYGNAQWLMDPDGYIQYNAFDLATGAQVKHIDDVNTDDTSEFTNLPSGWTTPTGAGLNLVTTDQVDALGRTTEETSPGGNITYYVYLDPQREERIYQGWNASTGTPTNPTEVIHHDPSDGYDEVFTMTAAPALNPDGTPNGTEDISDLQSLTRDYTNDAGQVIAEDDYFNLAGLAYTTALIGAVGVNFYQTQYGYDDRGRRSTTQTGNGTLYQTIYDSLDRPLSDSVGTDLSNMTTIRTYQYDNEGVGDGNLTQVTDYPGLNADPRVTQMWYDWRDRLVASKAGVSSDENDGVGRPIIVTTYDNLDEAIETQQYDGDGVTPQIVNGVLQALDPSLLRAQEIDNYDDQGRVYQTQVFDVNPATGEVSNSALTTNYYYDHRGDLMAESDPGGLWTKLVYDGAGRDVTDYTTDGGVTNGGGTDWAAASSVANDIVLEQEQTDYDGDDNAIETIDSQRFDDATGTGPLGDPTSGIGARVYYAAAYYDNADRLIASVDAGTNGGTAWTRPDSVPDSSPTLLVTNYAYNPMGLVQDTIDPQGIDTRALYDNLGRTTETIQDYTGGTPGDENDVTTEYGYDGDNNVIYVQADEPDGSYQRTGYVYGVTTADSGVNSNDILSAIQYPDPTTGAPSASQQESYVVNALGQTVQYTDRNNNVHQYSYDVLGRLISDAVTSLGAGVDGSVQRIDYGYDSQGNLALITSYDAPTGGNVVNQVQRVYNGLGQLTGEYQSHSGAVDTSTTPEVQYAYNEMSNGENNSRLVSMTYPSGYQVDYNYNSGLDDNISRLSSLSDNTGVLEEYTYLGLGNVVERNRPQINVKQTLIFQSGDTQANHDGGDKYTGLDRFGRVIDQNWVNATTGQSTDRFQYGYDQDSDVLYRQNLVDTLMMHDELYGYDNLHQLTSFQRGQLNATHDGIVGTPSRSQSWTPDALGNFNSVTTDGTEQDRTANQQNEITSLSDATSAISYDSNGNLTADGSGNSYTYDAWNRLVAVQNNGTTLASYSYDGLDRRITETHGGTTTDLYLSAQGQVLEEQVGGVTQARNVWSPVYINALVLRDQSSQGNGVLDQRLYVQQDANWNVTALVDTSGNVVERYDYDPYGAVTVLNSDFSVRGTSNYAMPYLWQGERYDAATGLYHIGIRDVSPTLMRPLQTDPIGQAAGNSLYDWEGNGPTDAVDPSGLSPWDYINAVGRGLAVGSKNLLIGAKGTAVEMVQMARDTGNTVIAGGSLITERWTGVYTYDLHSNMFGGYDRAVKNGSGDRFGLNAMANGSSLGLKPLIEGVVDYAQTGDATRASQTAGGVAASNLAGAVSLKVMPKMPLLGRRGKCPAATTEGVRTGPGSLRIGPVDGMYFRSQAQLNAYLMARRGRLLPAPVAPGVGTRAVMPPRFGTVGRTTIAGWHPALRINGRVYVHHMHIAAQELADTPFVEGRDLYGRVRLDATGNVVEVQWGAP